MRSKKKSGNFLPLEQEFAQIELLSVKNSDQNHAKSTNSWAKKKKKKNNNKRSKAIVQAKFKP